MVGHRVTLEKMGQLHDIPWKSKLVLSDIDFVEDISGWSLSYTKSCRIYG